MVNDDATTATATPEKPVAAGETTAPTGVEADIMDSVPKTMKVKAKKLVDRLKTQLSWTDRGELLYDGTPVPGSNMVDLVNDAYQYRKCIFYGDVETAEKMLATRTGLQAKYLSKTIRCD